MDKINGLNAFTGKVQNDLTKESSQKQSEIVENEAKDNNAVTYTSLDPDQVLDALKNHGLYNMIKIRKGNDQELTSISNSIEYFTTQMPPENYDKLTKKVSEACSKEFPNQQFEPEFIAQVVENLIFRTFV